MACTQCKEVLPIPECAEAVLIGSITDFDTVVYIFVKNLSTGRIVQQESTSDDEGFVTLNTSDPDPSFYSESHFYELSITKQSDHFNVLQEITVEGSEDAYTCLLLQFQKITPLTYTGHTISL